MARSRRVKYRFGKSDPNHESFNKFMMSEQVALPTRQITHAIKRRAERIGPESHDNEGVPYVDSFGVKKKAAGIVAGKYRNRRVAYELTNSAGHAPEVEFGVHDPVAGEPREGTRTMLRAGLIMSPNQRRGGGW